MALKKFVFNTFLVCSIIYLWVLGSFYRTNPDPEENNKNIFPVIKHHTKGKTIQSRIFSKVNVSVNSVSGENVDFDTKNPPEHDEEKSSILNFNVTLWGSPRARNLGSSPSFDRMLILDSWIKYLSIDSNLEKLKTKTLLIYNGGIERWGAPGPTSSKFCTTKCKYLVGPRDFKQVHGVLLVQDWFYHSDVVVPNDNLKILSFLESPLASRADLSSPNTVIASYNRDSDIVIPYGKWMESSNITKVKESKSASKNYASGKTKLAAAFMSNCGANNNRVNLVRELQKFMAVDVYGACGTLSCPRAKKGACFTMLKKDYKFYLAFENACCRDYVTEKLFENAFQNDIVPIVLGAHRSDYNALAPPHSFIHVEDFGSPEELTKYIKVLDGNDTLYNEYFKWRNTGIFYSPATHAPTLCRMCAMLHYADYSNSRPPLRRKQTWSAFDKCLPRGSWYWEKKEK